MPLDSAGESWMRFVGLPLFTSGHGESVSVTLLESLGPSGLRAHLAPVGPLRGRRRRGIHS
jgi:hypothetical protein